MNCDGGANDFFGDRVESVFLVHVPPECKRRARNQASLRVQRVLRELSVQTFYRTKREEVRSRNVFQFVTILSTVSPPNFSIAASASTIATMASPTTAAAGTAQTSLRSTVAGLSVIVLKSTERSGFISVEIGFM